MTTVETPARYVLPTFLLVKDWETGKISKAQLEPLVIPVTILSHPRGTFPQVRFPEGEIGCVSRNLLKVTEEGS